MHSENMSLDRHLLAVAEKFPVATTGTGVTLSSWAFWETMMQRGTTVFTFIVAFGGFILFVYNLRAARRKRAVRARCHHCNEETRT